MKTKTLLSVLGTLLGIVIVFLPPFLPFFVDAINITKVLNPETASYIFGDLKPSVYVASYFFGYLTISLWWSYKIYKGVVTNENTPEGFDISYFLNNNLVKIIFFLICSSITMLPVLRFPKYFLESVAPNLGDMVGESGLANTTILLAIIVSVSWEWIVREKLFKQSK